MSAKDRPEISVLLQSAAWRRAWPGYARGVTRAAKLTLEEVKGVPQNASLTVLLASDRRLHALDLQFRGLDKPTNVLSFPAELPYLGDIALAYGVTAREAKEAGKPFTHHATHLVVHGVLHLLGYDHESARHARQMERLERQILAMQKIPDPYTARETAAR